MTSRSSATSASAPRRDGSPLALARPPRSPRSLPHRRRHRARRASAVADNPAPCTTSWRSGTCVPRRTPSRATPATPQRSARSRGGGGVARRCTGDGDSVGRVARRASAVGGFTSHQVWDFQRTPPEQYRCCCASRTSTSTASRWSSRPIWCSRSTSSATRSASRKARDFALVAIRDSSLSACTGRCRGRGRSPRAGVRLLRRSSADGPARPPRQHRRRSSRCLTCRRLYRRRGGLRRRA